ncbi:MAG: hypothetical protein IJX98_06665 [Clostridia bacterium]|nr:hypothetical protein [Clostridia bacterium]
MKNSIKIKCAAFCSAFLLLFSLPKVTQMSTLKEFTSPHAGYYDCQSITIDGRELSDQFSLLRLELKGNGEMLLFYRDGEGKEGEQAFCYEYDEAAGELVITAEIHGQKHTRRISFQKGEIVFVENLGGRQLVAKFSKK